MPKRAKPIRTQARRRDIRPRRQLEYRKWYSSERWRLLRQQHLTENPCCVECLKEGMHKVAAMPRTPEVDHIKPHRGNDAMFWDADNLQTLCKRHHSLKTMRGE